MLARGNKNKFSVLAAPLCLQVDLLLQELLRLCQLAEEYNQFMLGKLWGKDGEGEGKGEGEGM